MNRRECLHLLTGLAGRALSTCDAHLFRFQGWL
jgi:hypothetical protein